MKVQSAQHPNIKHEPYTKMTVLTFDKKTEIRTREEYEVKAFHFSKVILQPDEDIIKFEREALVQRHGVPECANELLEMPTIQNPGKLELTWFETTIKLEGED